MRLSKRRGALVGVALLLAGCVHADVLAARDRLADGTGEGESRLAELSCGRGLPISVVEQELLISIRSHTHGERRGAAAALTCHYLRQRDTQRFRQLAASSADVAFAAFQTFQNCASRTGFCRPRPEGMRAFVSVLRSLYDRPPSAWGTGDAASVAACNAMVVEAELVIAGEVPPESLRHPLARSRGDRNCHDSLRVVISVGRVATASIRDLL